MRDNSSTARTHSRIHVRDSGHESFFAISTDILPSGKIPKLDMHEYNKPPARAFMHNKPAHPQYVAFLRRGLRDAAMQEESYLR